MREEAGKSQSWEHRVKEMLEPHHFSDYPPPAPPQPPTLPHPSWDTQTWLGRFLPSGVLHSTARGDSSTMSSKVSVLDPTWPRGQRETHQPQQHQAHVHETLRQKLQDSLGGAERRRQSDTPHPGSRAGSAGHPGGQLGGDTTSGLLKSLFHSFKALNAQSPSPLLTSPQEPAVIEPGTLIIGVGEEGILYQLQLCGDQGGTGCGQDPGGLLAAPTSHTHPGVPPALGFIYLLALHSSYIYQLYLSHGTLEFPVARGRLLCIPKARHKAGAQ